MAMHKYIYLYGNFLLKNLRLQRWLRCSDRR